MDDLLQRLRETLLRCGPFDSDEGVYHLFDDPRLDIWRNDVQSATTPHRRVNAVISMMRRRGRRDRAETGIVLLIQAVRDQCEPLDDCYSDLQSLAEELAMAEGIGRSDLQKRLPLADIAAEARSPETIQPNATLATINFGHQQREELQRLLEDIYSSKDALEQMVLYKLGTNLELIAGTGNLQSMLFTLIGYYHAHGETRRLIKAVLEDRPNHQELRAFAEQIGIRSIQ